MAELVRLTQADMPSVETIFRETFSAPPWNDDWRDRNQLRAYLRDLTDSASAVMFGLMHEGQLCGIVLGSIRHWYEGTEYYINELCIHPSCQGRGLGKEMMRLLTDQLRGMDIHHIFLLTEREMPAYSFYRACGFTSLEQNAAMVLRL